MPRRTWPAVLLLFALASVLRAQSTTASLNGRIIDSEKAVIVDASVAAIDLGTNTRYETTTNSEGKYYLTNLLRGRYRIEIEKSGFTKLIKSDVSLGIHDANEIDFELTLRLDEPASQQNALADSASAKPQASNDVGNDPTSRLFQLVLPSEHLLGDWHHMRSKLEEKGITPRLILVTDLAGNSRGGRSQGATAPSSVELSLFRSGEDIWSQRRLGSRVVFGTLGPQSFTRTYREHLQHSTDFWLSDVARARRLLSAEIV